MALGAAMPASHAEGPDRAATGSQATGDVLREMAELLGDARPALVVSGVVAAALTVGIAIQEAVLPMSLHAGAGTALCLGMFAVVIVSLARTVFLMLAAGRPMLDELGELRRRAGAPVEAAPWSGARARATIFQMPGWDRAMEAIAAAHFRKMRAHLALNWAALSILSFLAWSLVTLIVAGRL